MQHNATTLRRNIQAAMDIVSGGTPRNIPQEAAQAAWQALFFVVPVMSTTFASYGRLSSHLGREALGWLLIDEAGQATPQSAVGALWRTQRAVVAGDPLQLEPITSLPFSTEQAIRNELGVDEQWSPSRTSVQRLADRLTPLGTELPDANGKTWVGVPLSVHRRCDQPMFDIVNMIAYDGLMINGTGQKAGEQFANAYPTLPASKWIDIVGASAQGHWIPDEGRYLDLILKTLAELDFDMTEVMVVGPLRDVGEATTGRKLDPEAVAVSEFRPYDLGMEYRGDIGPEGYDRVVFRGDVETYEFVAFWLKDGRIIARMNVNVWDAGEPIEALIRSRKVVPSELLVDTSAPLGQIAA